MVADKTRETGFKARPAAGRAAELAKKVERARGMVLVAVVALLLLSAMGYLLVCAANPDLTPAKRLLLENRDINEFPECSPQTLISGTFQSAFEKAASDHMPARDELLQVNAAAQRLGIRTANLPFDYAAIPTYYGSDYAEASKAQLVQVMPATRTKEMKEAFATSANALNSLGEKIDGTLVYYRPTRLASSSFSPAAKLMRNIADESYAQDAFLDKLDDKWQIASDEYSSLEEYKEDFFRTDHHWKIGGAVKGYETIMEVLGKEFISFSAPESVGWPTWYGSASRIGIDFDVSGEKLQDVDYERSKLNVIVDGRAEDETMLDVGYSPENAKSKQPEEKYANQYGTWFHGNYATLVIENPSCENNETLLIIGDSYSTCIDRFFAESYARVVVIDPRLFEGSLSALIDEEKPRDVVCILSDLTVRSASTKKALAS